MSDSPSPYVRRRRKREPLVPARGLLAALVVAAVALAVLVLVKPKHTSHKASTSTTAATDSSRNSTTTTTIATTTTVDPGSLPQTEAKPDPASATNQARAQVLFNAVAADNPDSALPTFFPEAAYLQIKALANPAADYQNRLIAQFRADIHTLHTRMAPNTTAPPVFTKLSVVATPVWVKPGVESNKGSYWRVYDSQIHYTVGTVDHSFVVKSMISWRGEWYVVHLIAIR